MIELPGLGLLRAAWRTGRRRLRRRRVPVELFDLPWPGPVPSAAEIEAALRAGDPVPRVPATAIGLVRLPPRQDAATAAALLRAEGWRARPGLPALKPQVPIDWGADPHRDDNWRVQLNMLRLADPLIHAHEAGTDSHAGAQALVIVLDWHHYHLVAGHDNPRAWGDLVTGLRCLRAAYLADQCRLGALPLDATARQAIGHLLHAHWQRLASPAFMRFTNHTIWDLHALEALVRLVQVHDDARRAAWRAGVAARLARLLGEQFGPDGLHRENSPQYHFVASGMFRSLEATGWYADSVPQLAATLARAATMDGWMRLPDRRLLAIGDSDGSTPTALALPAPTPADAEDRLEALNSGGYTIVRRRHRRQTSRWSMLAIKAGIAGPGHRHADLLSYLWSESGCDIVIDPGKHAYDEGPLRDYFAGPDGHNLIVFDGRHHDARAIDGLAHLVAPLMHEPWGITATARLRHLPVDVDHERRFHLAPGRWLVVVDRFAAGRRLRFEHLTHLAPEFDACARDGCFEVTHADGRRLHVAWRASVPLACSVQRGVQRPNPQGWCSRGYRRAEPSPTLCLGGRSREAWIALALSLEPDTALVTGADGALQWRSGGDTLVLDTSALVPARIAGSPPTLDR